MPIEIDDLYYEEQKMLIHELYSAGSFLEGIKAAVITLNNLPTSSLKDKYYTSFCRLLAMGYRKMGNTKLAVDTIKNSISFVSAKLENDSFVHWELELAVLYMNLGVVYDNTGNHIGANDSYSHAMCIFEKNNDFAHLMMAYETILGTYVTSGRREEACETISKMKKLSVEHGIPLDTNLIDNYKKEME